MRCRFPACILIIASIGVISSALTGTTNDRALAQGTGATATALIRHQQEIFATQTAQARQSITMTPQAKVTRFPVTEQLQPLVTSAPSVEIVAARLNIRTGPGAAYSVLGLAEFGQQYFVLGATDECEWVQIVLDNGAEGWIAGFETSVRLNISCDSLQPATTATIQPTAIITSQPQIVLRSTPVADTPRRQPTPTRSTATPLPTRTPVSAGPSAVSIMSPNDGHNSSAPVTFAWIPDAPLSPGQEFEIVFWQAASETELQGRGWVRSGPETSVRIDPMRQSAGQYRWGIFVVIPEPYQRVRYLGPGFLLTVPGESNAGGSGGDDSGSDNGGGGAERP